MRFLRVNGHEMAYVEEGAGAPLLLVHGALSDLRFWGPQMRAFGLVEISAAGVTKAAMLQRCCARLGIGAHEVAAFGDMPNDVDMLSWVGMPYIVANAHPALRTLNFPVVPGNDESGVGRTIRGWLSAAAG